MCGRGGWQRADLCMKTQIGLEGVCSFACKAQTYWTLNMFSSTWKAQADKECGLYTYYRLFPFNDKKTVNIVGGLASLPAHLLEPFLSGVFEKRRMWCYEQAEMNKVTFETNNTGSASESFPKLVTFSSCSLLKRQAGAIKLLATGG